MKIGGDKLALGFVSLVLGIPISEFVQNKYAEYDLRRSERKEAERVSSILKSADVDHDERLSGSEVNSMVLRHFDSWIVDPEDPYPGYPMVGYLRGVAKRAGNSEPQLVSDFLTHLDRVWEARIAAREMNPELRKVWP